MQHLNIIQHPHHHLQMSMQHLNVHSNKSNDDKFNDDKFNNIHMTTLHPPVSQTRLPASPTRLTASPTRVTAHPTCTTSIPTVGIDCNESDSSNGDDIVQNLNNIINAQNSNGLLNSVLNSVLNDSIISHDSSAGSNDLNDQKAPNPT
eukprot:438747_1